MGGAQGLSNAAVHPCRGMALFLTFTYFYYIFILVHVLSTWC